MEIETQFCGHRCDRRMHQKSGHKPMFAIISVKDRYLCDRRSGAQSSDEDMSKLWIQSKGRLFSGLRYQFLHKS